MIKPNFEKKCHIKGRPSTSNTVTVADLGIDGRGGAPRGVDPHIGGLGAVPPAWVQGTEPCWRYGGEALPPEAEA